MQRPLLQILRLDRARHAPIHIFEQLRLEEALFRADTSNWIVINDGGLANHGKPSVVLGISGKPAVMCDVSRVSSEQVPLYRRFTGGGTVVVGEGTSFISFIGNKSMLPMECTVGPRELMQWSGDVYSKALNACGVDVTSAQSADNAFSLRENDYVLGNRKFAGNAQGLSRDRFVHHTSVLWNFKTEDMSLLQNPAKQPEYRDHRNHTDFLIPLSETMKEREALPNALIEEMKGMGFDTVEVDVDDSRLVEVLGKKHHKSSSAVDVHNVKLSGYPYVAQRW